MSTYRHAEAKAREIARRGAGVHNIRAFYLDLEFWRCAHMAGYGSSGTSWPEHPVATLNIGSRARR